jgi:broad specificity phosphatase PhoE
MVWSGYASATRTVRHTVTTRLLLARHGETDWDRQGRWYGSSNPSLNNKGEQQARALSAKLKNERLSAVYTSAQRCSVDTGHAVATVFKLNVCRDARLNEINLGAWEGMTRKDIASRYPDLLRQWESDPTQVSPPQGETIAAVEERVLAVLREITTAYPREVVCLIGHQYVNAIIRHCYLGMPLAEAAGIAAVLDSWDVVELPHPYF